MKLFSRFVACCLMALLPLQAIAATHIAKCNHAAVLTTAAFAGTAPANVEMPCHQALKQASTTTHDAQKPQSQKVCNTHCMTICAGLSTAILLADVMPPLNAQTLHDIVILATQSYTSIVPTNLFRPPIFLS